MLWSSPTAFQQMFGALLADPDAPHRDPAMARAIAIHRNTATKAALDALGDNYPVLKALVGEEAFTAVGLAYVADHPPRDPRLCIYGDRFPDFMAQTLLSDETAYVRDCALLERAVVEALFASDAVAATGQDFAHEIDLSRPLALHPATRLLDFASPAVSIWQGHQPGSDQDLATLSWTEETCLITRPANAVLVRSVDRATSALLSAMIAGATLGEAAEAALEFGDVSAAFLNLLTAGAFRQPGPAAKV